MIQEMPVFRPSYKRVTELLRGLQEEAPHGRIVSGLFQALMIAKANDIDAAAERHRTGRDV